MQAYQSPPCPYCGITWNPPGAQTCANCRNTLPPAGYAPPGYAPPGYAPPGYAPPGYAPPGYAPQGQAPPGQYQPAGPGGYPGAPGFPPAGYPQDPYGQAPPYGQFAPPGQVPGQAPNAAGSTLQLFGRSVALPFAIPTEVLRLQRPILYAVAGVALLLVAVLGVLPAVATRQISQAQQAIHTTVSHQAAVDAAFAAFFAPNPATVDPNAEKVATQKQAKSVTAGLASVQADESALRSIDQGLSWLQRVTPSKAASITAERKRLSTALTALGRADQALTAAVNEVNVALPYLDAVIDYSKMTTALAKHDLVGAGSLYPDAQQKMEAAMALDHAAGLPPALAKQLSSFNDALTSTESLVQALQAKDAAAVKKATDAIQVALKAMNTPAETVPADYETKTFGPMQTTYDAAMKALKA
ncbi:MAG: hypothetical protein M3Z11_03985 [Candidatus Dormibacteraeota bacterium]|nr:hypothetical protein [Candidatus Dormibacteraeota bacterium]